MKWIFERWHESPALQINNGNSGQIPIAKNGASLPGCAGRIIQRPQKAFLIFQQTHHLLLIPQMIPGSDYINTRQKNFLSSFDCDARAARRVLAISHDEINAVALP